MVIKEGRDAFKCPKLSKILVYLLRNGTRYCFEVIVQLSRVLEERMQLRAIETLGSRLHCFRSFSCRNYKLFPRILEILARSR